MVQSRHEENTIAQKNLVIARKHIKHLFGQGVEVVPVSSRVVRSAEHLDTDIELNANIDVKIDFNDKAKSETGMITEGWRHLENRWSRQVRSCSGVEMGEQKHGEILTHQPLNVAQVKEEHKADEQEQEELEEPEGEYEFSPGLWTSPRKPNDMGNHGHDHDHCAPTTISTTTPLPTPERSLSAAKDQGLKVKDSVSTAVPGPAYESEGLTSGDVKPHLASKREEDLQSSKYDRGETVDPNKATDEVSEATGTRCGVPVYSSPYGSWESDE